MIGVDDEKYRGPVPDHCMSSPPIAFEDDASRAIGGTFEFDRKKPSRANELYKRESTRVVSFYGWCSELLVRVLRSRTAFSAYVVKSIRVPRSEKISTSALFPVPVPYLS